MPPLTSSAEINGGDAEPVATLGNMEQRYKWHRIEPLLSVREVAEALGVSRATIYRLVERKELLPIRVHSDARFAPDDVRALIERSRERPEP